MSERLLTYTQAIQEATRQAMEADPSVLLLGMGVDDHKAIHGSTKDLARFFPGRVFDTPLSEDGMQGVCNGLAMAGMRPIHVYTRCDFALLAANQIVNMAAKARAMYGGKVKCPVVIRMAIGRSWGQGAQHSQGLHGTFAHFPGLNVVVPATPYHAKGLLLEALRQDDPTVFVEHRLLYPSTGHVPEEPYRVEFGRAHRYEHNYRGSPDVTIVAASVMLGEALAAGRALADAGLVADVVDPVTVSPLDGDAIAGWAGEGRGRLLVVDGGWPAFGLGAEVVARVVERLQRGPDGLDGVKVQRLGHAPCPTPTSKPLEDLYYPSAATIAAAAWRMVEAPNSEDAVVPDCVRAAKSDREVFRGPF